MRAAGVDRPNPAPRTWTVEKGRSLGRLSIIAAGTELRGRLAADSDLQFAGSIQGEIAIEGDLTVSRGAMVEGPVRARTVTVGGEVRGSVCAAERVEVLRGGSVAGELSAACIVLAEGSELNGRIDLLD